MSSLLKTALCFEFHLQFTFMGHDITNLRLRLSSDSPLHTSQISYFPNQLKAEVPAPLCMLLSMFSSFKSSQSGHKIRNAKKGKRNSFVICIRREKNRGFKGTAIDFCRSTKAHTLLGGPSGHGIAPVGQGCECSSLPASPSPMLSSPLKQENSFPLQKVVCGTP